MKRHILTLIALSAFAAPTMALASNWNIDSDHSAANFRIEHMMIAEVQGSFPELKGVANIDTDDISRSNIDVTIDAASIIV